MWQAPLEPGQLEQCAGIYRLSRLVQVAAEFSLAPLLAHGPADAADIALRTGADASTLRAVLDALSAWGVFERRADGRYALNDVSARLLPQHASPANASLIAGWAGNEAVMQAFAGLGHTLRTGESGLRGLHGVDFHGYLARHPGPAESYNCAMASTVQSFHACVEAVTWPANGYVVDVGGGRGGLLHAVLREHPRLRGVCLDLPHVIEAAHAEGDIGDRLQFLAHDAFDGVPRGAEAYLTCTVLRCFDDERAAALLARIRAAMQGPSTRLVCFEMLLPEGRDDPMMALADLTARVVYGGMDRTRDEFDALFARAGLERVGCDHVDGALHALTCRARPT